MFALQHTVLIEKNVQVQQPQQELSLTRRMYCCHVSQLPCAFRNHLTDHTGYPVSYKRLTEVISQ